MARFPARGPSFVTWPLLAVLGACASHAPTNIAVNVSSAADVNPDSSGRPSPIVARIYELSGTDRFSKADIFQLLDHEPDIQDAADAVELPPVAGDIDFVDVGFGYDERRDVLEDFNLSVKAGERVAIVGPSGSGKTTATLLVSRFYEPDRGAVLVDGRDVRGLTLHSLRSQIGVVFEESFLFSDSVKSNIAYGRPGASDEEIEEIGRAHV